MSSMALRTAKLVVTIFACLNIGSLPMEFHRFGVEEPSALDLTISALCYIAMGLAPWLAYPSLAVGSLALALSLARGSGLGAEPMVVIACLLAVTIKSPTWPLRFTALGFSAWAIGLGLLMGDSVVTWSYLTMIVITVLIGLAIRYFVRERTAARRRLAELEAATTRLKTEERERLAAELHDIVAHELSIISLQVMAHVEADDVTELRTALARTDRASRTALSELRSLVGVLRATDESTPHDPPHDLVISRVDDTAAMVETALREQGFHPTMDLAAATDLNEPLPTTLARILKETSTNILRYAEPGSSCHFVVAAETEQVHIQVTNPLRSNHTSGLEWQSTGWGLRGLSERVKLMGGVFTAGAVGRDWVVEARLPRHPDTSRADTDAQ
jgi:signal transduction histidine kinase